MLIFYSLKFPKVAFPKVNGNNDNWEHHHCWDYQEFPVLNSIRNRNKNRRESRSSMSFQQINSPAPIIKNAGRKLINRSKSICTIGQMYPEVIFKHFVLSDISSFHPSTFHPLWYFFILGWRGHTSWQHLNGTHLRWDWRVQRWSPRNTPKDRYPHRYP